MAIIRIKRTTTNSLPTGLTFGELAFVQGSGGYTANRLYIANNAGVCVWIGAEILNSPTYWSGATAETTIPTVSAVEGRIDTKIASSSGVTGLGATGSSWKKLAVSFLNSNRAQGATGFVNLLGVTWNDSATTNTTVGALSTGSSIAGSTVLEILERMLFSFRAATISSLSVGSFSSGNLELGQTAASSGTRTVTSSATNTDNIDSEGYSIVYSHTNTSAPSGSGSGTLMGATAYAASKAGINLSTDIRSTTIGSSFTFTARVSDYNAWVAFGSPLPTSLGDTASTTQSCSWWARTYWGKSATDGLTDPSLLAEGSTSLNTSASGFNPSSLSISSSATAKYLYVFVPSSYTVTSIKSGGVGVPLKNLSNDPIVGTVPTTTVTNAHGHSITYKIYQTQNTYFDAFTLVIA
jgi:hypothetical protein